MAEAKTKRGRPRKYDYVTITHKARLDTGAYDPATYTDARAFMEGVGVLGTDTITVEINGKRVKKFGGSDL